jgi:gliding motility-associated-like protein
MTQSIASQTFVGGWNLACNGGNAPANGSVNFTVNGGTPNYTFNWSNGATTQNLTNVGAGTYNVTATDANGCQVTSSITLTEPPLFESTTSAASNAGGWNISCNGASDGQINFTPTGGTAPYTYLWSNGATTQNLSNVPAGTYSVTATDANGCTTSQTITLTQPPLMTQSIASQTFAGGWNVSCFGSSDGSIQYDVTGGTPGYTYLWNNGATTQNLSGVGAGTYSVTSTDANGCQMNASITLTQSTGMTSALNTSMFAGGSNLSCVGSNDGSLSINVSGGQAPYSYIWNTGSTASSLSGLSAGTYSVIVTDALGCTVQTSTTLTEPEPISVVAFATTNYNGFDISCFNANDGGVSSQITNGVAPFQYLWFNGSNQIVGNTQSLSNQGPGQYSVMVTDQNGCQATATVTLTQPEPLFINLSTLTDYFGMAVSCAENADGSIGVSFGGGASQYTIQWQQLPQYQNSDVIEGLAAGNYAVVIFDVNGCQISDQIILDAHPMPEPLIIEPQQICFGEQVEISCGISRDAVSWQFSNGIAVNGCQVSFPSTEVGCISASITLTSQFGCVTNQTMNNIVCVDPLPIAAFNYSPNANISFISPNVYFTNQSENAETYLWHFGDGSGGSTSVNPQHTFPDQGPGQYLVTLYAYSEFGCLDTATQIVYVEDELIFYVPNAFTPDGDQYNNVFLPVFYSGFDPYNYTLYIFNRWGEILFESHDTNVGWDGTYGGNIVQDGVYIWKIEIKDSDKGRTTNHQGHVSLLR